MIIKCKNIIRISFAIIINLLCNVKSGCVKIENDCMGNGIRFSESYNITENATIKERVIFIFFFPSGFK